MEYRTGKTAREQVNLHDQNKQNKKRILIYSVRINETWHLVQNNTIA